MTVTRRPYQPGQSRDIPARVVTATDKERIAALEKQVSDLYREVMALSAFVETMRAGK